jgi:hypothetical protein
MQTGIDPVVAEIELAQAPQHFLNVDRIGPSPDGQLLFVVIGHALSLPLSSWGVDSPRSAKKRAFRRARPNKKSGPAQVTAEPDLSQIAIASAAQRPKNNHSRMITGIGTPNNQSRSPRPIAASSKCNREENFGKAIRFLDGSRNLRARCELYGFGISASDNPIRNSE